MLDAGDDGPGLHSTSPHSCNIATRTHAMERECPDRSGMKYVDRLHGIEHIYHIPWYWY